MTDNEIIRVLEKSISAATEQGAESVAQMLKNAVDLINRQKAEITQLQKRIVFWREDIDYRPDEIKSKAIKEFAVGTIRWCNVKLNKKSHSLSGKYMDGYKDGIKAVMSHLSNVKKMTEEEIMDKYFKVKYNDFVCPDCGARLHAQDLIKTLRIQYEPDTDAYGYLSLVNVKCDCGNRYKIYCQCHELNNRITVVVDKIKRLANFGKDKKDD